MKLREIEKKTNVSRSTIYNWLKNYKENGTIKRKIGSVRKLALYYRDLAEIITILNKNTIISIPKVNKKYSLKANKKVSNETIRRYLKRDKIYAYSSYKKPLLSKKKYRKKKGILYELDL